MKNVTITLPDDLARSARVEAAKQGKSLSRFIADLLAERFPAGQMTHEQMLAKLEKFWSGPGYPGIAKAWRGREALYAEGEDELLRRYKSSGVRARPKRTGKRVAGGGFADKPRDYRGPRSKPAKPE
jgi:hypothetical protein